MQYQAQWIGHWYVVADWLEVLVGVVWQVVSVLLVFVAVVVGVGRGLRGKSCWSSWLWWWQVLLYDLHILALGCDGYVPVGWKGPCACLAWLHSRGVERALCRPGFTRGKGLGNSLNLRQRRWFVDGIQSLLFYKLYWTDACHCPLGSLERMALFRYSIIVCILLCCYYDSCFYLLFV